jgi:2-dehydro-3-deoxygluconokinase
MTRVACIGECMIEMSERADGTITRAFGGDTLNTAVYLARLGVPVDYVTGLGDDTFSDAMETAWRAEGIGTDLVVRFAGRLPGLYVIQNDERGERRFFHWRDRAPARDIFECAETPGLLAALSTRTHAYLSGISLSLYGVGGRATLFEALDAAATAGTLLVFDTNFRARGWPDRAEAQRAYRAALARARLVFASAEDLEPVFGRDWLAVIDAAAEIAEVVLKLDPPGCRVRAAGVDVTVPAPPVADVIDTTAAGDAFAAAYLAARIGGADPPEAARAGHALAGRVVQHRGAIIPRASTTAWTPP